MGGYYASIAKSLAPAEDTGAAAIESVIVT